MVLLYKRINTEWGLKTWTPLPFSVNTINSESIEVVFPGKYVTGMNMPFIMKTLLAGSIKPLYLPVGNSVNGQSFNIKRGIGSTKILTGDAFSEITFTCGVKSINLPVVFESPTLTVLGGIIAGYYSGLNGRIRINADVTIPAGDTLLIEEGSIVVIDEAVDINNFDFIKIKGSAENLVVITCSKPGGFWGGFLSIGPGNGIEVSFSIFYQSGYHTSPAFQWGHARRQR